MWKARRLPVQQHQSFRASAGLSAVAISGAAGIAERQSLSRGQGVAPDSALAGVARSSLAGCFIRKGRLLPRQEPSGGLNKRA